MKTLKDLRDKDNPDIININIFKEAMNQNLNKIDKILMNEELIDKSGDLGINDVPNDKLDAVREFIKFLCNI